MCHFLDYWKKIKTELEILSCNVFFRPVDYNIWLHLSEINLLMQITFPPMSLAPQIYSKTMIAISTPHISTFDLSPPEWKLHTGVERSKVEVEVEVGYKTDYQLSVWGVQYGCIDLWIWKNTRIIVKNWCIIRIATVSMWSLWEYGKI